MPGVQHGAYGSTCVARSGLNEDVLVLFERAHQQCIEAEPSGQAEVGRRAGHTQYGALDRFLKSCRDGWPYRLRNRGAVFEPQVMIELRAEAAMADAVRIEETAIQTRPFRVD